MVQIKENRLAFQEVPGEGPSREEFLTSFGQRNTSPEQEERTEVEEIAENEEFLEQEPIRITPRNIGSLQVAEEDGEFYYIFNDERRTVIDSLNNEISPTEDINAVIVQTEFGELEASLRHEYNQETGIDLGYIAVPEGFTVEVPLSENGMGHGEPRLRISAELEAELDAEREIEG